MPWSLRKFLSKETQQTSTDGGDKGRGKSDKSSKLGKLKQHFGKGNSDNVAESSATNKQDINEKLASSEKFSDAKAKLEASPRDQSSDDSFVSGDSVKDETVKSDDEYKSIEDFPADCSNLTGYLETAIMDSDTGTLERYGKSMEKGASPEKKINNGESTVGLDGESVKPSDVASSSFDRGLYIEYVNYDILGQEGGGSNGGSSGEYYSSDEEKFSNSNNNSNSGAAKTRANGGEKVNISESEQTNNSPRVKTGSLDQNEQKVSNNIPNDGYYNENIRNHKTEKVSSSATDREKNSGNGDKSSEKYRTDIDPNDTTTGERNIQQGTTEDKYHSEDIIGLEYKHNENCPLYNGNADIKQPGSKLDMEKARSLFGMCLCQNAEQVDNVTDLDFRNCNLKEVPQEIFQYTQTLTHLQLDSNTLSDLPKSLFTCENLEYLTVSDNDLGSLPPTLAGLQCLKYLDISKNVIEDVPDCIRCCRSLNVLDASVNPIEKLSEGFTQLVGLNELYLNDCFLEFLPANFGRLVQLTVLELRDNQLQILPKSIRRLTLLKRLDLGGNIFQEWPTVVCELRKLTELWLDGNELSKVPDEIGDLTSLVYLDLSRNFIEAIPSQIGGLRELTDLLLCENHITTLPDTIGFLDKLTMFKVSMNQLTGIPESIGKLREIEELDLSHNKIIDVPSSIGNLRAMHTLLLDNNILPSIPPEVGGCVKLNVLQLSRNVLDEIPREIGELSQLRVFNICRNRLQHLPITVIKLAQLEALWVSSNQSKPNVPLHAELHKDGKTRILTNILFPQTEHDTVIKLRNKTDDEGYANDAADDDEPPLFRKQRGITRVAFNLQLIQHQEPVNYSDNEEQDIEVDVPLLQKDQNSNTKFPLPDQHNISHSVDVSADLISTNGNGLHIQPTSLLVRSPEKEQDEPMENGQAYPSDTSPLINETSLNLDDNEIIDGPMEWTATSHMYDLISVGDNFDAESTSPNISNTSMDALIPDLLNGEGNLRSPKIEPPKSFSVPDLSKVQNSEESVTETSRSTPVDNMVEVAAAQPPKIKTWSSHSHLPAIPDTEPTDVVKPVAAEIISNRSSMSSSPCSTPESPKTEPAKISKLPIPSRALFEDFSSTKTKENKTEPPQFVEAPFKPPVETQYSLTDIPFMDSESDGGASDEAPLIIKPKKTVKPPPPPRKDSLLFRTSKPGSAETSPTKPPIPATKPIITSTSGLKIFTPSFLQTRKILNIESERLQDPDLLALPVDNKPHAEVSMDGLASLERDSGVGNDADSQESMPECPDDDLPLPPHDMLLEEPSRAFPAPIAPKPTIKSVANFHVGDTRPQVPAKNIHRPPSYNLPPPPPPITQSETFTKVPPPVPNKISANIKMFESISSPEHKPQPLNSKSLADLLPSGPRKTEEKAIIRPNNHLNGFVDNKNVVDITKTCETKPEISSFDMSPTKSALPEISDVIIEPHSREVPVMFVQENTTDSDDAYAFSKALSEVTVPTQTRKLARSNSKNNETTETAKQTQFRERLEKIMQQQKNVSAATKAVQNGAMNSLSRKASFNNRSQPASPDGLEHLTAENSFPSPESPTSPSSPEQKHQSNKKLSVHDKMKNKLDRLQGSGNSVKSASQSRIARARPGSAPAAQLLQRCNSNQRNSIAAPENSFEEKRTLAPLYGSDERAGLDARSRSKSIEQQLGQLFLDSDEEQLNHNERANYERHAFHNHNDVMRREHALKKHQSGMRGSRNSLCSPPPVRHNMYAKQRSSNNTSSAPLADWKHKLLQHIERKRMEKQQISAVQSVARPPKTQQPQQSIGKIKSPPRTSGPPPKPQYNDRSGVNHVTSQPQSRWDRQLSKSVTAPSLMAPTKTITNTHRYIPEGPAVRSHFAGNSRAAKLAKQRTFTPGPENHGNVHMMAPRPKSAMEKYASQSPPEPLYAEPPTYRQPPPSQPTLYADLRTQNPPLPTYEDHLHRRVAPQDNNPGHRLVRSESTRKSFRGSGRGNYEDIAGYQLRQSGSHESIMDPARYNQHEPYFPTTPIRNASSHDSILDQPPYPQTGYSAPYYSPPQQARRQNNVYQQSHAPQRYPAPPENPKRNKYNSPDYVTYVNVYDYERSPVEYHSRPPVQNTSDPYRSQSGYRGGNGRGESRPQRNSFKRETNNYSKNYAYPPTSYQDPRQPPTYEHYRQRESISPTLYRPLAEREEGSVASAFRPYNQVPPSQQKGLHHHNHHSSVPYAHTQQYGLPPNNVLSPTEYKNQGRHMSPPSTNYQYLSEQPRHLPRPPPGWTDAQEDFENVTVNVRRNPTFGFHVMGGVGAGGNPYQPIDDGVFVTHVTPGGAADNKLQAGDKILLVNGSDFVGISHKRAVDLLRNAGQVAVLVVERSLGKPV